MMREAAKRSTAVAGGGRHFLVQRWTGEQLDGACCLGGQMTHRFQSTRCVISSGTVADASGDGRESAGGSVRRFRSSALKPS